MEGRSTSSSKMLINSYCTTKHHIPEDNDHHHCSMLTVSELSSNKHSSSYYFHYLTVSVTFVCQTVVTKIYACREVFVCAAQPTLMFFSVKVPQVLFSLFNFEPHFCFLGSCHKNICMQGRFCLCCKTQFSVLNVKVLYEQLLNKFNSGSFPLNITSVLIDIQIKCHQFSQNVVHDVNCFKFCSYFLL